jgi:hypothetical protein
VAVWTICHIRAEERPSAKSARTRLGALRGVPAEGVGRDGLARPQGKAFPYSESCDHSHRVRRNNNKLSRAQTAIAPELRSAGLAGPLPPSSAEERLRRRFTWFRFAEQLGDGDLEGAWEPVKQVDGDAALAALKFARPSRRLLQSVLGTSPVRSAVMRGSRVRVPVFLPWLLE